MASGFLLALAKKPAPERGGSSSRRGDPNNMAGGADDSGGSDDGKSSDDLKSEPKDPYSKVTEDALGKLADILGVSEDDRAEFDSALEDLCEACAKRAIDEEGRDKAFSATPRRP